MEKNVRSRELRQDLSSAWKERSHRVGEAGHIALAKLRQPEDRELKKPKSLTIIITLLLNPKLVLAPCFVLTVAEPIAAGSQGGDRACDAAH